LPGLRAGTQTQNGFLALLSSPTRRALENAGISTLAELSEAELIKLYGMGPGSLPSLRDSLAADGKSFKQP
jgi:hypothetical protein